MATAYVLYNDLSSTPEDKVDVKLLEVGMDDSLVYVDISKIKDYHKFLGCMQEDEYIIICGGDGTLNRFVNDTDGIDYGGDILYFPNGTGNDFAHELGYSKGCDPFSIKEHLKDLPLVTVNGKSYRFLNGVGYGIDGYCCEVGDELKKKGVKKVNYTSIAIKGLLFHYKPTNATVTVDGVTRSYKKVWLAPTMNGKYYGGGMMATPNQDRHSEERMLSAMVLHDVGKLRTLCIFPSIFKGEHIKHTDIIDTIEGHEITVTFDRPSPLQIDGETLLGVTSYTAVKR